MATKRGEILLTFLQVVGLTGVVVGGALCPGLLMLLKPVARRRYSPRACRYAVQALDTKGWIVAERRPQGIRVRLTARGRAELLAYELGIKVLKKPRRWDGKWHLLIFDIEEKHKHLRDAVRQALRSFGFHRLQDSVWIFPYECREILDLLRIKYGVRTQALYLRADYLDQDHWLRRHFQLKT